MLALLGTGAGYALLAAVLGVVAQWSRAVAIDQGIGLGVHAAVVFLRGVLPTVVATGAACLLWRRQRGTDPNAPATVAVSLAFAVLATWTVLTSRIGGWPRLEVQHAADAIATVLLLAAAGVGSELLARHLLRRRLL